MTVATKLRTATGAAVFRPSDIAGLAVWYKADGLGLADNTAFTFTGATNGLACAFYLRLTQDGTGGWAVTWPGSVKWAGGTAPTLSTGINKVSALTFETTDGGTTRYGFLAGDDLR